MPKLISLIHPYEFDKIKCVNDFFVFTKNILRIIEKKGCQEKKDGILIPLRWSKAKCTWVVDRGTGLQRDIQGIDLNNITNYFDMSDPIYTAIVHILNSVKQNSDFNMIANKINLVKNDTKFIAFEYISEKEVYPLGVYQFYETKKRKGRLKSYNNKSLSCLVDDSNNILEKIANSAENFIFSKKLRFERSYIEVYKDFVNMINQKVLDFIDNNGAKHTIDIKKLTDKNIKLNFKNSDLKVARNILNNKENKSKLFIDSNISSIFLIFLCVELGLFIKKELLLRQAEGFVVQDNMSGNAIKITGDKILEDKIPFKKKKVVIESKDNYFLLPKAY
jgi:hypothetical protein